MISTIEPEKYVAGTTIFGIIIGKLYHKKKPCLIILLKVDKSSEIGFDYTILPLNLAIYLRVENNREYLLDAKEIT